MAEDNGSGGETWMLDLVKIDQEFRCSGAGTRCHERCYIQVRNRSSNTANLSIFSLVFPLIGFVRQKNPR